VQSEKKTHNYFTLPADAASALGKANSPSTVREEGRQLLQVARRCSLGLGEGKLAEYGQ
jgi:hypothetical protein